MTNSEIVAPGQAQVAGLAFDYTGLEPEAAAEAQAAAARIRKLGIQQNEAIFAIGGELIAIRAKLGHGNFGPWLGAEFGMSISTAERYIRVVENLSDKIVTVTNLQPTTLYLSLGQVNAGHSAGGDCRPHRERRCPAGQGNPPPHRPGQGDPNDWAGRTGRGRMLGEDKRRSDRPRAPGGRDVDALRRF